MAARRNPDELVDPLEGLLGYQLRRAALATMTALDAAYALLGLKLTEAVILRFVGANPGCNQAAISRALGVTRTNMVPFVGSLVEAGLVEREASDGRTHALFLTAAGEAMDRRLAQIAAEQDAQFFGAFDPTTREVLVSALQHVRRLAAPVATTAGETEASPSADGGPIPQRRS
jgi:DNA-binding MarR family transcriptional regulator